MKEVKVWLSVFLGVSILLAGSIGVVAMDSFLAPRMELIPFVVARMVLILASAFISVGLASKAVDKFAG